MAPSSRASRSSRLGLRLRRCRVLVVVQFESSLRLGTSVSVDGRDLDMMAQLAQLKAENEALRNAALPEEERRPPARLPRLNSEALESLNFRSFAGGLHRQRGGSESAVIGDLEGGHACGGAGYLAGQPAGT